MHCTGHCSLFNVHCTLYTLHCTLNTVGTLLNVKVSPMRYSTICHPTIPRSWSLVWDKRTTETAKLGFVFHEASQNQQNEPINVAREASSYPENCSMVVSIGSHPQAMVFRLFLPAVISGRESFNDNLHFFPVELSSEYLCLHSED